MLQRNGRLTNLPLCNTLPHYNRSPIVPQSCDCAKEKSYAECSCGKNGCNCGIRTDAYLAISSIGIQEWREIYNLEEGFKAGTIFRQLDLPFCGMKGGRL